MPNIEETRLLEQLTQPVVDLMQECNNEVIAVICRRLSEIGKLSATDAIVLSNMAHTKDLDEIKSIISTYTDKSVNEVDTIIKKAAERNDLLAKQYYKVGSTIDKSMLDAIMVHSAKRMKDDILNLSNTLAFVIDGKPITAISMYNKAINQGIYAVQQGYTDYNTAIHSTVKKMADSGIRKIDFATGYSRRADSQVRMNVLDGVRQMNQTYREEQGKQFGADGVEISVHDRCAVDHQEIQGKQLSIKEFDTVQETGLYMGRKIRPIGAMNCKHSTFPIILGVSNPIYSNSELTQIKRDSNKTYTYTAKDGTQRSVSGYNATQLQRRQETTIRRLKDRKNAYSALGDEDMVKKCNKDLRYQNQYYKQLSTELGVTMQKERLFVAK